MSRENDLSLVLARRSPALIAVGLVAAAILAAGVFLDPAAGLGGLLVAFLFWIGIPMGSAVLLDIHALTGGAWGEALRPLLARCAMTVPLFIAPFACIVLGATVLYPWASDPSQVAWDDVAAHYLDRSAFLLRGGAVMVIWSVIAVLAARRTYGAGRLGAGIALALYGITITLAAVDWSMSLSPRWSSSTYPAITAIGQITAALAFAAITRLRSIEVEATSDLASLIVACVLGYCYLGFMQYLVIWAGNLPDKAAWYVARFHHGWGAAEWVALVVGGIAPLLLLLRRRSRQSPPTVAAAGALVMAGLLLDRLWQVVPSLAEARAWWFGLAVAALGALWIGVAFRTRAAAILPVIDHV